MLESPEKIAGDYYYSDLRDWLHQASEQLVKAEDNRLRRIVWKDVDVRAKEAAHLHYAIDGLYRVIGIVKAELKILTDQAKENADDVR